jgi:ABC-type branched-subunit amino acid transport system substrate-binding protein
VVEVEEDPYYQEFLPAGDHLQTVLPDPVRRLTGLYFQQPDQDRTRGPAIGRSSDDDDEHPNVDFDVLFIPDAPKKAGLIIPQLLFHDIKDVYLAGTNLWHSSQLVDMAQDYLQRAILVEGYFKDSQSAPVRRFVEAYQSAYKEPPGIIEAYAFDTARIFFELLAKPDIHMHHTLRDALIQFSTPYGVTGFTAFTDHGEAIKRLTLLEIKAGKFVEITHP